MSEQLLVETTQAIIVHLETCPSCRAEVEGLRRLRAATRTAFESAADLAPNPAFVAELSERLRAEAHRPQRTGLSRRSWLATAAGVIVTAGAAVGFRAWSDSIIEALVHAAVGDHRFCALSFRLAEAPIPLAEAARRYGNVYALLDTVQPLTTSLPGGRLELLARHSCVFDGRRFAHLVFRYKEQIVSLLVADDERGLRLWAGSNDAAASHVAAIDGFNVASFRGADHVVFLVSSLSVDDVRDVAKAMTDPVLEVLAGA